MPVSPRFRDTEKGYYDEEDSRKSFSGAGEGRNLRSPEQFSPEELGADGSLPTCSHSNAYQLPSSNASAGPPESSDSKASQRKRELNRRLLYNLYRAQVNNNEIKELLKAGADPNAICTDHGGNVYACHFAGFFMKADLNNLKATNALSHASENWTPLHVAAYFTLPATVRLLLKFKADPNICDDRGRTPLDVAGLAKAIRISTILHKFNGQPSEERMHGGRRYATTRAYGVQGCSRTMGSFTEVIELLIDAGGKQYTMIGDYVKRIQTPLHTAVELENQDAVDLLLRHGASAACWDEEGLTPLHLCALNRGPKPIFTALISKGPDVVDSNGETALRVVILNGWLIGVLEALAKGADITLMAKDGETPLHVMAQDKAGWYDDLRYNYEVYEKNLRDKVLDEIVRVAKHKNAIECLNRKGFTPLFTAVQSGRYHIAGKLLQENASIQRTVADGLNLLHVAAKNGRTLTLDMLLKFDENATKLMINSLTESQGYGPIHFAVAGNHLSCVQVFCNNNIKDMDLCLPTDPKDTTPLHKAGACENVDINSPIKGVEGCLQTDIDKEKWELPHPKDTTPLHGTDITKDKLKVPYPKGTTPLHMAAANDNVDIASTIIQACKHRKENTYPLDKEDKNGWLPLHSAINKNNVNVIKYFVKDLNESLTEPTRSEKPKTALDMIIKHVANPTKFLNDLLDSCISYDYDPLHESSNKVKIYYRILMPKDRDVLTSSQVLRGKLDFVDIVLETRNEFDQMRLISDYKLPERSALKPSRFLKEEMDVVQALLKTGNEFNQKALLLHPLIESFIHLKWQTVKKYYFFITSVYTLLLAWLVGFEVSVFNDKDICNEKPSLFKSVAGGFMIYLLAILIILQELLRNFEGSQYFGQWRSWLKLGCLVPVFIVPPAVPVSEAAEWTRHVATLALFLVCFQMMNFLSQFPEWGYYVVMFKKVSFNVVKILASFSILLFCFAFSFKIQFHSEYPFDGPWGAIVKTLFMLSAEFEYNDVFESKNAEKLGSSLEVVRIILLVFLVLVAFVLMNMMVGVAVDDIKELTSHGRTGKLEKQAYFVRSLDRLNYNLWNSFSRCMPQSYQRKKFPPKIILAGDVLTQEPDDGYNIEGLPKTFKDEFYKIAQKNKEKEDNEASKNVQHMTEQNKHTFFYETTQRLDELEAAVKKKIDDLNATVRHLIQSLQIIGVVRCKL